MFNCVKFIACQFTFSLGQRRLSLRSYCPIVTMKLFSYSIVGAQLSIYRDILRDYFGHFKNTFWKIASHI